MSAALTLAAVRPVDAPSPRHLVMVSDNEIATARRHFEAEEAKKAQSIALMKVDLQGHHDRLKEIAGQIDAAEQQVVANVRRLEEIKKDLTDAGTEHKGQKKLFNTAQANHVQKKIENLRAERKKLKAATCKLKSGLDKLCAEQKTRTEQANKLHDELRQLEKPVIIRSVAVQIAPPPVVSLEKRQDILAAMGNGHATRTTILRVDFPSLFDVALECVVEGCSNPADVRVDTAYIIQTLNLKNVDAYTIKANIGCAKCAKALAVKNTGDKTAEPGMKGTNVYTLATTLCRLVSDKFGRRDVVEELCPKKGSSVVQSSPNQDWLAEQGVTPNTTFTCTESKVQGTIAETLFVVPASGEIDWQDLTIDVIRQNTISSTWYRENKPDLNTMELGKLLKVWAKKNRTGRA